MSIDFNPLSSMTGMQHPLNDISSCMQQSKKKKKTSCKVGNNAQVTCKCVATSYPW